MSLLTAESLERLRILSCDLAEHWVMRVGKERHFVVWVEDGDVMSFSERAQKLFDLAGDCIEQELILYVDKGADEDVVIAALAEYGDAAMIRGILARLA